MNKNRVDLQFGIIGPSIDKSFYDKKYDYYQVNSKKDVEFLNENVEKLLDKLHVKINELPKFIQDEILKEKEMEALHETLIQKVVSEQDEIKNDKKTYKENSDFISRLKRKFKKIRRFCYGRK